jgi:hypothetical protein
MSNPPPPPPPYPSYPPYDQDTSHLNTLSIFYYILAGLQCLGGCVGIIYIGLGVMLGLAGAAGGNHGGDAAAGATMGGALACVGVVILVIVGGLAYLNFLAGQSLRQRKRLALIYVMAAIACLNLPLGTILGIFTFVVLSRPSVKASFENASGATSGLPNSP